MTDIITHASISSMEKPTEKDLKECIYKLTGLIMVMTVNLPSEYAEYADKCVEEMFSYLRESKLSNR